jgi:hypothetical protein
MGVLRRITALATGLLVLQLTLLGGAAPCADHGGALAETGHAKSGGPVNAAATATAGHEDCDGAPTEPGRTESTGRSCIGMISCITPMLQLGAELAAPNGVTISRVAAVPLLEPPTRTTAPELPPPRA